MKGWVAVAGAAALMVSNGAGAQSAEGLLNILKRGLGNARETAVQQAKSPYIGPAGMYWDLDPEDTLAGAQRLRHGRTSTGGGGAPTCDMQLVAMAHSEWRMGAAERSNCVRNEFNIVERVNGKAIAGSNSDADNERRYGPLMNARMEKFRSTRRFAVRHDMFGQGGIAYNERRGVLDAYVPIPGATALSVTGPAFVPWHESNGRAVWSPPNAGRFHMPVRMSEDDYRALTRRGREPKDDLVVFTVNRVWTEAGSPSVPRFDVTVERVHIGYRGETIEVDLTQRQAAH